VFSKMPRAERVLASCGAPHLTLTAGRKSTDNPPPWLRQQPLLPRKADMPHPAPATASTALSRPSTVSLWGGAALLASVFYLLPLTLEIPLLDPDEGLHAAIAQEMLESGDWVTPRFRGEAFRDKPILYFWAQVVSLATWGHHEAAVRLPGMICGLLGTLSTMLLAWRLFGRETGLLAGFFQATMVLPLALTQAAVHDVALGDSVAVALMESYFYTWQRALLRTSRVCEAYKCVRVVYMQRGM